MKEKVWEIKSVRQLFSAYGFCLILTGASLAISNSAQALDVDGCRAYAVCALKNNGGWTCDGPLQQVSFGKKSQETALEQAGCPGGAKVGTTGKWSLFQCQGKMGKRNILVKYGVPHRGGSCEEPEEMAKQEKPQGVLGQITQKELDKGTQALAEKVKDEELKNSQAQEKQQNKERDELRANLANLLDAQLGGAAGASLAPAPAKAEAKAQTGAGKLDQMLANLMAEEENKASQAQHASASTQGMDNDEISIALLQSRVSGFPFDGSDTSTLEEAARLLQAMGGTSVGSHSGAGSQTVRLNADVFATIWINTYDKKDCYGVRFGSSSGNYVGSNDTYFEICKSNAAMAGDNSKAGETFKDCPDCPEMVVLPAGSFQMGMQSKHRVTIDYSFAVGKYEITQAEYRSVMGKSPSSPGDFFGDNTPVEWVSWDDAQDFIAKLNARTGLTYRLLSEAEWEYAARAGTSTDYSFGNAQGDLCEYANGSDQSVGFKKSNNLCNDGYGKSTSPVGSFKPNSFGLHDMHGNVNEWVEDCHRNDYDGAPTDGSAWADDNTCTRVYRGGGYLGPPHRLRSANRYGIKSGARLTDLGFRLARTLADEKAKDSLEGSTWNAQMGESHYLLSFGSDGGISCKRSNGDTYCWWMISGDWKQDGNVFTMRTYTKSSASERHHTGRLDGNTMSASMTDSDGKVSTWTATRQ